MGWNEHYFIVHTNNQLIVHLLTNAHLLHLPILSTIFEIPKCIYLPFSLEIWKSFYKKLYAGKSELVTWVWRERKSEESKHSFEEWFRLISFFLQNARFHISLYWSSPCSGDFDFRCLFPVWNISKIIIILFSDNHVSLNLWKKTSFSWIKRNWSGSIWNVLYFEYQIICQCLFCLNSTKLLQNPPALGYERPIKNLSAQCKVIFTCEVFELYDIIDKTEYKPVVWWRYINDIFWIWTHGPEKLTDFISTLNTAHPTIKFTH